MKTIGLIGGMSWESSALYYRIINEEVKARLGGLHSAKCILYSVDFEEIEIYQRNGEWEKAGNVLVQAARSLEAAGADFILLCTNTMHKIADQIEANTGIPLLHIADITAAEMLARGIKTAGLLGTRYTMEQGFYKSRLERRGIRILVPGSEDRESVNRVIYQAHSRARSTAPFAWSTVVSKSGTAESSCRTSRPISVQPRIIPSAPAFIKL
jgi:aspartate racemase